MAKTKTRSFMLTEEEDRIVQAYVKQRLIASDERITQSDIFREAIFKLISSNGQPDNKQDDKQEPAETPTNSNPFSDLSLD